MRKFFSLLAAVLFAGSMMATEVVFTNADFAGQGTANTGSEVTATKDGVTFTFSKGYSATESLRCYAHGALTISAESTIEKINFTTTGGKTGGLDAEVTVGATSYSVEDLASQARFTEIKVTLGGGEVVPPTPADTYTVAGNDAAIFGEAWNPALAANDMTLADGVYTWTKANLNLTAGTEIQFKVVKNHSWDIAYPAQNYVVNIAEAGEYTLTITFDPTTEAVAAEAVKKVIPQYEVAEAIAAGLADNTEILVRGVITKIEFKGKNFAKYGSVNIYVADATNAEGVFEFYNCYSLNADTFRTSTPAYDAESNAWVEFEEVVDKNGTAVHVGDTVIAFGKYKLYSGTHELNTGCYLTEIKHSGDAPVVEHTYTVAGAPAEVFGAEWDPTLEANDMQPIVGGEYTHSWQKENVTLAAGKVEFKVVEDHDWANPAYPAYEAGNYELTISEAAIYTISIFFNEETKEISANALKTGEAPVVDEWAKIVFTEAVAADDLVEDASFTVDGSEFALTLHDSGNKMAIDGNDCRFGTADSYTMYNFRIKSGGASSSDKNYFTLNIPEAGTLRIAPRTGSNGATDRALIVIQGGDTLYNQIVQESQAIEVQEGENTVKVYPYVDVTVAAGEVVVRYTAGMNFYAFAFKANEPEPEVIWTVAGSKSVFGSEWSASDANNDMVKQEDGTYKWEKENITLAAGNVEFKVVKDHKWAEGYPASNYQLAITEDGVYTISITFNAETKEITADATKTGEAEIDPVVSIAGAMNGWNASADVMNLAEDKATATLTLNLDATTYEFKVVLNGGDWRSNGQDFTRENASATDMTGNEANMHLVADVAGEYVFTWTFADNSLAITYPEAPAQDIEITLSSLTTPGSLIWTDAVAEAGWWQIMGANEAYGFSISNVSTTETAGVYTVDDLDADFSYINIYGENDTTKVAFLDGSVTVAISEEGIVTINGTLVGSDGNNYIFNLTYKDPVAENTVNVEVPQWQLVDDYVAYLSLFAVAGEDANGTYVQLALNLPDGATAIAGDYTEEDFDLQYFGCYVADANNAYRIFSATIKVAQNEDGKVFVTADLLCYNNTLYKVTTPVGEGINAVEAAVKAIKRLVNGQVVIEKAGKTYNMNGAVIR